jgi:hypothetical protein
MKISYEESVVKLAGKLLFYAVKELALLVMILVFSGILIGNALLVIAALLTILGWVSGYCTGRRDESEVAG